MKTIYFLVSIGFYNSESKTINIGGVETYIYDLAKLSETLGYYPVVYEMNNDGKTGKYFIEGIEIRQISQKGKTYFQKCFDYVYKTCTKHGDISYFQKCFDYVYKTCNKHGDIFIISTDQLTIRANFNNVISINHGIAFDEPICGIKGRLIKFFKCIRNVQRGLLVPNVVCVDYNYYNWFRTLSTITNESTFTVIPNYSKEVIEDYEFENKLKSPPRKIIFARRFVEHRGVKLFAEAISHIMSEYPYVEVTFAGAGPLEQYLKNLFSSSKQVHFTTYKSNESVEFHKQFDIAVVPTIFSEGTSLSLCEAMSAGCYCIATRVGGLTNILVDRYNGRLVEPTVEGVYQAIKDALNMDTREYKRICRSGYETATYGFSKKLWDSKWSQFIFRVSNGE